MDKVIEFANSVYLWCYLYAKITLNLDRCFLFSIIFINERDFNSSREQFLMKQ